MQTLNWQLILIGSLFFGSLAGQEVTVSSDDLTLYGTLLRPQSSTDHAVLIISGSGNTDRNGNTPSMGYVNDGLKKLAEGLTEKGFATLRYDKRGVGKSVADHLKAENLRFEQYASDAVNWITFLRKQYKKVSIIGHSQGALVGMVAAQQADIDRFVSLAGLAMDAHSTIRKQLQVQPDFVRHAAFPILDSLKAGVKVDSVPSYLNSLASPKIQDYVISFMKFDPRREIRKLSIPIMVVQGTTDLQIGIPEAKALSEQTTNATFQPIDGMNHVLRKSSWDTNENMGTYANASLPLHPEVVGVITQFLQTE